MNIFTKIAIVALLTVLFSEIIGTIPLFYIIIAVGIVAIIYDAWWYLQGRKS